jgi:lipid-A-disaccharide synthase
MAARNPHFFVSAAEPSADIHCAHLVEALRRLHPDARFTGLGGPAMKAAGCTLLADTTARAAMTYNVLGQLGWYRGLIKKAAASFQSDRPDLVIVCDSPALNFHIAKAAKAAGTKTLFYVAPQLWAWAPWRIGKLKRLCDKLCCILPFEEEWFKTRGLDATYVGNPLLAGLDLSSIQNPKSKIQNGAAFPAVALMPGSRKAELDSLWLPMQQVALRIKEKFPQATFTAVAVSDQVREVLKSKQLAGLNIEYVINQVFETAGQSDFTLVASGSATLQVAAAGCPMAIMYQSNPILWHLVGRWLLRIPYLSLPNILAKKEIVPEFMPYFRSTEPISKMCIDLLEDDELLEWMRAGLIKLTRPLAAKDAPAEVAAIASSMVR